MNSHKKKLLVTARDPSAANDLAALLPGLAQRPNLEITLIAQDPAFEILRVGFLGRDSLENAKLKYMPWDDEVSIENCIRDVLASFQPDMLLTGISGPDFGVDEIALKLCQGNATKTYSVQSYWGDLNCKFGITADTVFVIDQFAAELTRQRYPSVKTVITGPFQTKNYAAFDALDARMAFREGLGLHRQKIIVGFFGQPLFEYQWYKDTLSFFADTFAKEHEDTHLLFKPHPKETSESIAWFSEKLSTSVVEFTISRQADVLTVLSGIDLAVSLFSTIGYNLQNLVAQSEGLAAVPMYLFYEKQCRNWYKQYCGLEKIPMTYDEMAIVVEASDELSAMMARGLDGSFRERCSNAIKKNFPAEGGRPVDVLVREISA